MKVPKEVLEDLKELHSEGETLLRVIRFKDSYANTTMHWVVHESPREDSEERLLAVVALWKQL